eukprot:GILJ01006779.1.p1 GENE.GILJ01006779.1~~GILJ01006779.1.p1  ORF type:complete len:1812 (+),score=440.28 GILJ01006779.1:171-5606(+)
MSELLANWLNHEVELSDRIENFERDFANGYFFGELLYKFSQQPDFPEFINRHDTQAKVHNFSLLYPTMKNLGLKFASNQAHEIMRQERGASLRLLYQVKMALEKISSVPSGITPRGGDLGKSSHMPTQKITVHKSVYENMEQSHFEERLRASAKPLKQVRMQLHLKKFHEAGMENEVRARTLEAADQEEEERQTQERRRAQIGRRLNNTGFMEQWQQRGEESWKKNQEVKQDRERTELRFEMSLAEQTKRKAQAFKESGVHEVESGIDAFERNLARIGVDDRRGKDTDSGLVLSDSTISPLEHLKTLSKRLPDNNTQRLEATVFMEKVRENKVETEIARKERERRRRRVLVDQAKTQEEAEMKKKEDELLEKLLKESKEERQLAYESWRTAQYKQVIVENRKLREDLYEARRQKDLDESIQRDQEMFRVMQEKKKEQVAIDKQRYRENERARRMATEKKHTESCSEIFDLIFDIADAATQFRQLSDEPVIDSRVWREWTQLFVDGLTVEPTPEPSHDELAEQEEKAKEIAQLADAALQERLTVLDNVEFDDYLTNINQWDVKVSLKPAEPIIESHSKGAVASTAQPAVQAASSDTETDENPILVDHRLGQIVADLIESTVPQPPPVSPPAIPDFPLRVCLTGKPFSGKRTHAIRLAEKYNLKLVKFEDVIQEAMDATTNPPSADVFMVSQTTLTPAQPEDKKKMNRAVSRSDKDKENTKDVASVVVEPSPEEVAKRAKIEHLIHELIDLGSEIVERLKSGEVLDDALHVRLFVNKIHRLKYMPTVEPAKDDAVDEKNKKVKDNKKKNEKAAAADPKLPRTKTMDVTKPVGRPSSPNQTLPDELIDPYSMIKQEGWLLVGFPETQSQIRLLEQALSGYVPPEERTPSECTKLKSIAARIAPPPEVEAPPVQLLRSGIDAILRLDVDNEELLRRASGRRKDPQTGLEYHIEDNPPPQDQLLLETLVPVDDPANPMATLPDRFAVFDSEKPLFDRWMSLFGFHPDTPLLWDVSTVASKDEVFNELDQVLNRVWMVRREELKKANDERQRIEDELRQAELAKSMPPIQEEQVVASVAVPVPVEAPAPPLLTSSTSKNPIQEKANAANAKKKASRKDEPVEAVTAAATVPVPAAVAATGVDSIPESDASVQQPPAVVVEKKKLDEEVIPILMAHWNTIQDQYISNMTKNFRLNRVHRDSLVNYFSTLQRDFISFLRRPDEKQKLISEFQVKFNQFTDENPDMRQDESTKAELHQRIDDLSDQLWNVTLRKKDEAEKERSRWIQNGWVKEQLLKVTTVVSSMLQLEVDRYIGSRQLLKDYSACLRNVPMDANPPDRIVIDLIPVLPDPSAAATVVQTLPPLVDELNPLNYPRLNDLIQRTVTISEQSNPLATPSVFDSTGKGKGSKAAAATAKDEAVEEDVEKMDPESRQIYEETKAALAIESRILKYRALRLKVWAETRMKEITQTAQKSYEKMDRWITLRVKCENDAIRDVTQVVKDCIEKETKLLPELRIENADLIIDSDILMYEEKKFEPPAPIEEEREDRFTSSQLKTLQSGLREIAPSGFIPDSILLDFLEREAGITTTYKENRVPKLFGSFKRKHWIRIINEFDPNHTGYIDWREMFVSLMLCASPIASISDLANLKLALTGADSDMDGRLYRHELIKVPFWFDRSERQAVDAWGQLFDRPVALKEALFDAFSDDENEARVSIRTVLLYLCADPNPKLGLYKAFHVFSDDESRADVESIYSILHQGLAKHTGEKDELSVDEIRSILSGSRFTFDEMQKSKIGRYLSEQSPQLAFYKLKDILAIVHSSSDQ